MATYNIDFSDPLRSGFSIVPGGFNGPGGAIASSPLRLYGRGALEWGEAVDENMLRMLENWNGATPPPYPVAGQFWFQSKFFWLQTGVNWYIFDLGPNTWSILTPVSGTTAGTNVTPPLVAGTYWYTAGAPSGNDAFGNAIKAFTLYIYEQEFNQVANGWVERTHSTSAAAPVNGTDFPVRSLLVWDDLVAPLGAWSTPPGSFAILAAPTPPVGPAGSFWWDTVNLRLYISNGVAWVGVILASGTVPMAAILDLGTHRIINVVDPVGLQDAATKNYVDVATGAAALDLRYLRLNAANSPLTGALAMGGNNITGLPVETYPLANSNNAASITYANGVAAASAAIFSFANNSTSVAHKIGDIYVDTVGPIIYIATATVTSAPSALTDWKQVWPAQYS